jgi:pyruvate ferredoxin oxidoreductase gamma subunit
MYRIRFHGRGGQGMKTASRMLGTAFFLEGFEVQDAPRYGAERRGAPIFAYVRVAQEPINERGIITHPDLVVVADDSLVSIAAAGVCQGLTDRSVLLINSHDSIETWSHRLNLSGPIVVLPTREESADRAELPFVGAACAGAAARLTGTIARASLQQAIREELAGLSAHTIDKNLDMALHAYDEVADREGIVTEGELRSAADYTSPAWLDSLFEEARVSAPAIHAAANSVQVRPGLWRTLRPVVDYGLCNRCWWVCSTFCPDSCIEVSDEGYPQIDYEHCKGCMICVAKCPPHAIAAIPETEARAAETGELTA